MNEDQLTKNFQEVKDLIDGIARMSMNHYEKLDAKIDDVEVRLAEKINAVETKLESKIEHLDMKVDNLDRRLDNLVDNYVTKPTFKELETRVAQLEV